MVTCQQACTCARQCNQRRTFTCHNIQPLEPECRARTACGLADVHCATASSRLPDTAGNQLPAAYQAQWIEELASKTAGCDMMWYRPPCESSCNRRNTSYAHLMFTAGFALRHTMSSRPLLKALRQCEASCDHWQWPVSPRPFPLSAWSCQALFSRIQG
jgi:hypothetical protein